VEFKEKKKRMKKERKRKKKEKKSPIINLKILQNHRFSWSVDRSLDYSETEQLSQPNQHPRRITRFECQFHAQGMRLEG